MVENRAAHPDVYEIDGRHPACVVRALYGVTQS